ncbi:MAG: ABC transporter permease [Bdellovibrionota bacterium]|nr:ABC transporter permease [Bdellovibrionota bacterium]
MKNHVVIDAQNQDIYLLEKSKELFRYSDLLRSIVRREFKVLYRRTILGPIWYLLQPLLASLIYVVVFDKVANISTDGLPSILFYLLGSSLWGLFSDSLVKSSDVFVMNQLLFEKVYFPRLIMPIAMVISIFPKFFMQMLLFSIVWIYYFATGEISPSLHLVYFPLLAVLTALFGFSLGLIVSAITVKFRDLLYVLNYLINILMYLSPVIYPVSIVAEQYRWMTWANPLTSFFEFSRLGVLGKGELNLEGLLAGIVLVCVCLYIGLKVFFRVEKSFIDTI